MSGNYNQALTQWEGEPEFVLRTNSAEFGHETDTDSWGINEEHSLKVST